MLLTLKFIIAVGGKLQFWKHLPPNLLCSYPHLLDFQKQPSPPTLLLILPFYEGNDKVLP